MLTAQEYILRLLGQRPISINQMSAGSLAGFTRNHVRRVCRELVQAGRIHACATLGYNEHLYCLGREEDCPAP